jgi:uncharacterized protein with ParB-like and HNH nuclease domain
MLEDYSFVSIETLLARTNLKIPVYQRPYKWTVRNVNQLIDDILFMSNRGKSKYRIGTVVLHKNSNGLDIVDG